MQFEFEFRTCGASGLVDPDDPPFNWTRLELVCGGLTCCDGTGGSGRKGLEPLMTQARISPSLAPAKGWRQINSSYKIIANAARGVKIKTLTHGYNLGRVAHEAHEL